MSLHVSPLDNWKMRRLSFSETTEFPETRPTFFVFLASGGVTLPGAE